MHIMNVQLTEYVNELSNNEIEGVSLKMFFSDEISCYAPSSINNILGDQRDERASREELHHPRFRLARFSLMRFFNMCFCNLHSVLFNHVHRNSPVKRDIFANLAKATRETTKLKYDDVQEQGGNPIEQIKALLKTTFGISYHDRVRIVNNVEDLQVAQEDIVIYVNLYKPSYTTSNLATKFVLRFSNLNIFAAALSELPAERVFTILKNVFEKLQPAKTQSTLRSFLMPAKTPNMKALNKQNLQKYTYIRNILKPVWKETDPPKEIVVEGIEEIKEFQALLWSYSIVETDEGYGSTADWGWYRRTMVPGFKNEKSSVFKDNNIYKETPTHEVQHAVIIAVFSPRRSHAVVGVRCGAVHEKESFKVIDSNSFDIISHDWTNNQDIPIRSNYYEESEITNEEFCSNTEKCITCKSCFYSYILYVRKDVPSLAATEITSTCTKLTDIFMNTKYNLHMVAGKKAKSKSKEPKVRAKSKSKEPI
jgi:hypothetical protein